MIHLSSLSCLFAQQQVQTNCNSKYQVEQE